MARRARGGRRDEIARAIPEEFGVETADEAQEAPWQILGPTVEVMLRAELDAHLGYASNDKSPKATANRRNGYAPKTVRTSAGELEISVPRDRDGSFEPVAVPKGSSDLSDVESRVISMYARGMSQRDIARTVREIYGFSMSAETVSAITDRVWVDLGRWRSRPLEPGLRLRVCRLLPRARARRPQRARRADAPEEGRARARPTGGASLSCRRGRAVVLAHHRRPGGVAGARRPEAGGVPGGPPRGGEARPRGLETRLFAASSPVMRLRRARDDGRPGRETAPVGRVRLPVIDELGFLPLDADGARLLFQVFADAYERRSAVIATNPGLRTRGSEPGAQQVGVGVRGRPDGRRRDRPHRPPREARPVLWRVPPCPPCPHT